MGVNRARLLDLHRMVRLGDAYAAAPKEDSVWQLPQAHLSDRRNTTFCRELFPVRDFHLPDSLPLGQESPLVASRVEPATQCL